MQMTARASAKPCRNDSTCMCLSVTACGYGCKTLKNQLQIQEIQKSYWHTSMARNTSTPTHKRNAGRSIKIPSLPWCLFLKQCGAVLKSRSRSDRWRIRSFSKSSIRSRGRSPPAIDISDIIQKNQHGPVTLSLTIPNGRHVFHGTPMEEALSPQGLGCKLNPLSFRNIPGCLCLMFAGCILPL